MITVREQYQHYIEYDHSYMAHMLHLLLKEGHVGFNDDCETIDYSKVDETKVNELVKQNYLCFNPIKVYSLKVDDYLFAFVFAKNEEEAITFTKTELKEQPRNCHEYQLDIEMERGERVITFRDMKKEHDSFPALAGYFETDPVYR